MKRHLASLGFALAAGLVIFAAAYVVGAAIGVAVILALLVAAVIGVLYGGFKAARWRSVHRRPEQRT